MVESGYARYRLTQAQRHSSETYHLVVSSKMFHRSNACLVYIFVEKTFLGSPSLDDSISSTAGSMAARKATGSVLGKYDSVIEATGGSRSPRFRCRCCLSHSLAVLSPS